MNEPINPTSYEDLNERERQVQASIWALNFLLAELASGVMMIRKTLIAKGTITEAEDDEIARSIGDQDNLNLMYRNTELAFMEKYQRIRFAHEHPEEVAHQMNERTNNEQPKEQ
jgi:hypothetical protein